MQIRFYETDKAYGCFSNFSRHPVSIDGLIWPTSEHYFQAQKFLDKADAEAVRAAPNGFVAAQIGRERHRSFRQDWDAVRDQVMLDVLRAKFAQHAELREILVSTQGAQLIEHTKNDRYWADGGDGTGQNMLGILLEKVRSELPATDTQFIAPPWITHPEIEVSDTYWRMGKGEGESMHAARFRDGLSVAARKHYEMYFPVPLEWRNSW
jgi:ribA/ribD-fused uncharacterized protein